MLDVSDTARHDVLTIPRRLCDLVHGSLARAGKVKSQTPKVEKQEKKKTPKGRAKKRLVYNRRCVVLLVRSAELRY